MVRGRVAGDSVADVGPASVMVGNIVQGNRLASAQGRDMGVLDEDSDNAKKVCKFNETQANFHSLWIKSMLMVKIEFIDIFFNPLNVETNAFLT